MMLNLMNLTTMYHFNMKASELLELVFERYLSRHKYNLEKRINELQIEGLTFETLVNYNLIFELPDKRSWQRQYSQNYTDEKIQFKKK